MATLRPFRAGPSLRRTLPLLVLGLTGCDDSTGLEVRTLTVVPEVALVVGAGAETTFEAVAVGEEGVLLDADGAEWTIDDSGVASIDGGRVVGLRAGLAMVTARLGGRASTATVEVYLPPEPPSFEPGASYFGREGYTEYVPGTLPLVLSAGHGGDLTPDEIPDRTYGVVVRDSNTRELTYAIRDALVALTGHAPHVVVSHLRRTKLDPNREIDEAAQGSPFAERAWVEYHGYIERARSVASERGQGMYLDIHGHGHPTARLELGYLLSGSRLDGTDASLDSAGVRDATSIRALGQASPLDFSALLRGSTSFGAFLGAEGVAAVPSPDDRSPNGAPYYSDGYSTRQHGSRDAGQVISAIQIEHHFPGLRDTNENRQAYAERLARAIRGYMLEHIGYFEPPSP